MNTEATIQTLAALRHVQDTLREAIANTGSLSKSEKQHDNAKAYFAEKLLEYIEAEKQVGELIKTVKDSIV